MLTYANFLWHKAHRLSSVFHRRILEAYPGPKNKLEQEFREIDQRSQTDRASWKRGMKLVYYCCPRHDEKKLKNNIQNYA